MALIVGNATVATGMSPIVEAGLYADQVFIDDVSFTSQYDLGQAGQIQVEKYTPDNSIEPKTPGSNFSDTEYSNTVININCVNSFQKSQKVPAYFEATMPTDVLMNKTLSVSMDIANGRQKAAIAALVDSVAATNGVELTADNIKVEILASRKDLRDKNASPDVVIASVETYSSMLELAGKDFTPMYNEDTVRSGKVGLWMGMLWLESSLLGGSYKYRKDGSEEVTVDTTGVDFIMYDHRAFSIIDKLAMLRVIDSENFAGSKIQMEVDTGFAVTNTDCVVVRSSTAG